MIDYQDLAPFDLYLRFKRGDERAFSALYDRLSPGLYGYLCRMLGDRHRAEDVLVVSFTKLSRSNLDGPGNVRAWLYRVATNECYKWFRKNREIGLADGQQETADKDEPRDLIREMRIRRALDGLPETHRVVVVLKFYERMSYQEIAEVLCLPLGTVKSRMHDGLERLRRIIKK
jgi:RNA polymerase sigma-70 factor (ECF subfamily)